MKPGILTRVASLCDEEPKVVLKCVGTTKSTCYEDHLIIPHISAGTGFWTYVDGKFLLTSSMPPENL
jgi:hypothetical protein